MTSAKKDNLDDYELFYMEIPKVDYMDDIEIQDEYDSASPDQPQGLSDEQVSKIAHDSLDVTSTHKPAGDEPAEPE